MVVITTAIVSFILPPVYEAKAGVVIVRFKSEITFDPKFRTLTEEELAKGIKARRDALEALVKSSPVASEVIAELGPALGPEERGGRAHLRTGSSDVRWWPSSEANGGTRCY
jgi:uncharacterized protein involved in exopolysaccharide biosynthesis